MGGLDAAALSTGSTAAAASTAKGPSSGMLQGLNLSGFASLDDFFSPSSEKQPSSLGGGKSQEGSEEDEDDDGLSSSISFSQNNSTSGNNKVDIHQQTSDSTSIINTTTTMQTLIDMSKHPSGIIPTLQNIVATVNLECRLDLKHIALHARNAEYNPKRFAAVIMRIREPKTTALIFSSGKMVVTGAKSEELCRLAARKYARIVQKLGFPARFTDFKVQNIVGSCDVRFPVRLEGLAFAHGSFSSYEPELFPGLVYRMVRPKVVLLIFVSGKIVLTGARVREEIYQAFENIYPVLSEFRKP